MFQASAQKSTLNRWAKCILSGGLCHQVRLFMSGRGSESICRMSRVAWSQFMTHGHGPKCSTVACMHLVWSSALFAPSRCPRQHQSWCGNDAIAIQNTLSFFPFRCVFSQPAPVLLKLGFECICTALPCLFHVQISTGFIKLALQGGLKTGQSHGIVCVDFSWCVCVCERFGFTNCPLTFFVQGDGVALILPVQR